MSKHLLLACLAALCAVDSNAQTCTLVKTISVKRMLGNTTPNALKLFDVAVDETRAKVWISPIANPYLISINLNSLAQTTDSIPIEAASSQVTAVKFLTLNPVNGWIVCVIGGENEAKLYNTTTGALVGTYSFTGSKGGINVDEINNQVLICDGSNINFRNGTTFAAVGSAINFGLAVSSAMVDHENSRIFATSKNLSGGNVVVKKYNLTTHALDATYSFSATEPMGVLAIDTVHERIILGGTTTVKVVNLLTGAIESAFTISDVFDDLAYSVSQQKIILTCADAYGANGLHGKWSKRYEITLPAGTTSVTAPSGDKVQRIGVDNSRNLLIQAHQHRGNLSFHDLSGATVTTLDVGDAAHDLSVNGSTVFAVNRLGGSRVTAWNLTSNTATDFNAGVWPTISRVDAAAGFMFVLNHFTSSIQRRNLASYALVDSVLLGSDEARTDGISTLFLEESTNRLFAVFPELEKLFVVDGSAMSLLATIDLSGWYSWNNAGGIGDLQVAAGSGKIFVFDKYGHKLARYDATTFADDGQLNLTPNWTGQSLDEYALAWDNVASKIICGDLLINPTATWNPGSAIEIDMNLGGVFAGYNSTASSRIFLLQTGTTIFLKYVNPATHAVTATCTLMSGIVSAPTFYIDRPNNRLFLAEFNTGLIWHWDISSSVLPVEMTGFEAEFLADERAVRLVWEVSAEVNVESYFIEKSSDGIEFQSIGRVNAASKASYLFYDEAPFDGWSWFRLKILDFDGATDFSPVRSVFVENEAAEISLFPNPCGSFLNLKTTHFEPSAWRIFDLNGRVLMENEEPILGEIDVSSLPPGPFFMEMGDENRRVLRQRFLKI